MRVINARNVNYAYGLGLRMLCLEGERMSSRAGDVMVMPCPVTTMYNNPTERVLFCKFRDANPFFHLFESLWMLAGRRDSTWLDMFVGSFSKRFAEGDGNQHGAYGHRWRCSWDIDQLEVVIARLQRDPTDRRAVIAMWDPDLDLYDPRRMVSWDGQAVVEPKDLPCNTHLYPRVLNGKLDMTICCRSNDVVWGAYGANAVHFSMLQEYLAGKIGVKVGTMYQLSNNYHGYVAVLDGVGTPTAHDPYSNTGSSCVRPLPISAAWLKLNGQHVWDTDLRIFMDNSHQPHKMNGYQFMTEWFAHTALPMFKLHHHWKLYRDDATSRAMVEMIEATDWRRAAREWIARRVAKQHEKQGQV